MSLRTITRREASAFAALTDAFVAPAGPLPPVAETDAVRFWDGYLARLPAANRAALRGLVLLLDLAPALTRRRRRLRRLSRDEREAFGDALEGGPLALAVRPLRALAQAAYYGDVGPSRALGFDPDALVARGRALRAAEGRP